MKEREEQKAAEERMKEQKLTEEEARWKHEEEKRRAAKQHEMRLKQQYWEKYIKDMEKEKVRMVMQKIEEKYGSELLSEVRKDMGLPSLPVPNLDLSPSQHPSTLYHSYGHKPNFSVWQVFPPGGITPSGLLAKVKQEKYHRIEFGDPENPYKPSAT